MSGGVEESMPVDFIGLYDFSVDVDNGLFSLVIDFAMTKHCPRFFKKVTFEFCIDGEPDGWDCARCWPTT